MPHAAVAAGSAHAGTAHTPADTDVVGQIERAFRLLGRRVYGEASARTRGSAIDRVGVFLLAALENADLRPSDLAAAVELELSTVSRRLSRLESARLIRRRPDLDDGRVHRISLTSDGREVLERARAARTAVLDDALGDWGLDDRRQLLHLLDRLSADLDRGTADAPPSHLVPTPSVPTLSRKSTA